MTEQSQTVTAPAVLRVFIEKAYNLSKSSDCFCKVRLLQSEPTTTGDQPSIVIGEKQKTKTVKKSGDPVWDEELQLIVPSSTVLSSLRLEIRLFEERVLRRSALIDTVSFSLDRLYYGDSVKKVFSIEGQKNLVGQLYVKFTAENFGRPLPSVQERAQTTTKRIHLTKACELFKVPLTGNLVKDYKELRARIHQWRLTQVTMENVASLTFHYYDSGAKGHLLVSDLTRMAQHILSFLTSNSSGNLLSSNTKRLMQKWEKHKEDHLIEYYNKQEFIGIASDILKQEHFLNKAPITKIVDRSESQKFNEMALTVLGVLGFEKSSTSIDMYNESMIDSQTGVKPFHIAAYLCPQERPLFQSNLAQLFFDFYHLSRVDDDGTDIDNPSHWRMTPHDFQTFLGHTDNKMKNILVKSVWESYALGDFRTEFVKLEELNFG